MPNLMMSWEQGSVTAAALLVVGSVAMPLGVRAGRRRIAATAVFVREAGVVMALYAVWQLAGFLSQRQTTGALAHAHWIWDVERIWHLPSELSLQRAVLPHPLLVQGLNVYYATMHFTGLIALLVWLFVRHRDQYARVRTTIVLLTASCLLIQFVPVAPPRLLPHLGFVDTAARYGQSVYVTFGHVAADQLSAMPSVHVAWALLVAVVAVDVSRSRWRWVAVGHAVITVVAVVATANHFWLDGLVAAALLAFWMIVQRLTRPWWRRLLASRQAALTAAPLRKEAAVG